VEIQRAAQRYDQLPDGRVVPGEGPAGGRLLEGYRRRRHSTAQQVAALTGLKVNDALLEMRVPIIARPYLYTPDHRPAPVFAAAFVLRDSGPAAAESGLVG